MLGDGKNAVFLFLTGTMRIFGLIVNWFLEKFYFFGSPLGEGKRGVFWR
jgi:hypothetical protein